MHSAPPHPARRTDLGGAVELGKARGVQQQNPGTGEQQHSLIGQHKMLLIRLCKGCGASVWKRSLAC